MPKEKELRKVAIKIENTTREHAQKAKSENSKNGKRTASAGRCAQSSRFVAGGIPWA